MANGLDFFGFLGTLSGLLSSVATLIRNAIIYLLSVVQAVAVVLANVAVAIATFVWRLMLVVGRWARHVWERYIRRGILSIWAKYQELVAWLERVLGPVIRVIRRIRAILDYWFFRIFGPIINLIQRLRIMIAVLKIFGVKWARRLDERLLRLEGKIAGAFLAVRRKLNEVVTTINLVLDPELLLRGSVIGNSLLKYLGAIRRIIRSGGARPLTASEEESQKEWRAALARGPDLPASNLNPQEHFSRPLAAMSESVDAGAEEMLGEKLEVLPPR